jgi:hypothetical protein
MFLLEISPEVAEIVRKIYNALILCQLMFPRVSVCENLRENERDLE